MLRYMYESALVFRYFKKRLLNKDDLAIMALILIMLMLIGLSLALLSNIVILGYNSIHISILFIAVCFGIYKTFRDDYLDDNSLT